MTGNTMRRTYSVAFGGVMSALSVVIMMFSTLLPSASLTLGGVAGFLLVCIIDELGISWGWAVYAVVSVISLLLVPEKDTAISYIMMFGLFTVLKYYIENVKRRWLRALYKFIYANVCLIAFYLLVTAIGIMVRESRVMEIVVLACGNLVFFLYDFIETKAVIIYRHTIAKKLHKGRTTDNKERR